MFRTLLLLLLTTLTSPAWAGQRVACRILYFDSSAGNRIDASETFEKDLVFRPFKGNIWKAEYHYELSSVPDVAFTLIIWERFTRGEVAYTSRLRVVNKRTGKILKPDEIEPNRVFGEIDKDRDVDFECGAFEQTVDYRNLPSDPREFARRAHFNDGATSREYTNCAERSVQKDNGEIELIPCEILRMDVADVLKTVLRNDQFMAPLLDKTIAIIKSQHVFFAPAGGSAESKGIRKCPRTSAEKICEEEEIWIQYDVGDAKRDVPIFLYGKSAPPIVAGAGDLQVQIEILRAKESRWIESYRIKSFGLTFSEPETGGGSSSSGGRIGRPE